MLDYKRESNGYRAHGSLGQFTKALSFTTVRSRLRCSGSTRSVSLKSRTWLLPHIGDQPVHRLDELIPWSARVRKISRAEESD